MLRKKIESILKRFTDESYKITITRENLCISLGRDQIHISLSIIKYRDLKRIEERIKDEFAL